MKAKIMLMQLLLLVALASTLSGQQVDKPIADDLADQKNDALSQLQQQRQLLADTDRALHAITGKDVGSARAEGARTQWRIAGCLAEGDYSRRIGQVYATAEAAAGRIADELDRPSPASTTIDPDLNELHHQLDQVQRRRAEIERSPSPTSTEEIQELAAIEVRLNKALAIYQELNSSPGTAPAAQMRMMRDQFAIHHQSAVSSASAADVECQAQRRILVRLKQTEDSQNLINSWSHLLDTGDANKQHGEKDGSELLDSPSTPQQKEAQQLKSQVESKQPQTSDPQAQERIRHWQVVAAQANGAN
jgi:hypothetical protein